MPDIKDQIKFGTDGWRGVISDNFTFENVRIVAQAIAEWLNRDLKIKSGQSKKRVAVGYDTRFLSAEYAETVACVLAANGIEVYLSDRAIPTPALSYGVVNLKGVCGVMITAVLLNFANVVGRYVLLQPIVVAEEVLQFMNVWVVMLGAATITRSKPVSGPIGSVTGPTGLGAHQSRHISHTFPCMSYSPHPLGS